MAVQDEINILVDQSRQSYQLNHIEEAILYVHRLLELDRHNIDGLFLLSMIFIKKNMKNQAVELLKKVLSLNPTYLPAINNLGALLLELNQYEESLFYFNKAIMVQPQNSTLHINAANALFALKRFDEALHHYDETLRIESNNIQAMMGRAKLLSQKGYLQEALSEYHRILSINPHSAEAHWAHTILDITIQSDTFQNEDDFKKIAVDKLNALSDWCDQNTISIEQTIGFYQLFSLAYKQRNNKTILSAHGKLCCSLMKKWLDKQPFATHIHRSDCSLIRVGIVSANINNHSVWHAITKCLINYLDKTVFELSIFCIGNQQTAQTQWAALNSAHIEQGSYDLQHWVESILKRSLDVLIYPAIGMDMITLQLASLRLAPIQIASWGHPETSGLPTIDYYLSSQAFEPNNSHEHYTEQLICLPHIGTTYTPLAPQIIHTDLATLGINTQHPIIIAAGTCVKYDTAYDSIFVEIAKKVGACTFVFFESYPLALSEILHKRIEKRFEEAGLSFDSYVVFIPWQHISSFFSIMQQADIFLDTIGFSGFNTTMQAIECELPIVAFEGKLMRGRFASGILRSCELDCLVATTLEEYIAITVQLAKDASYRKAVKKKIKNNCHFLYNNSNPIAYLSKKLIDLTNNL